MEKAILYAGESIISDNCLYLLRLGWDGNLVFYDFSDGTIKILWQTNTSLINSYVDGQLTRDKIKFFFADNLLWVTEDKYPNSFLFGPNCLWTDDVDLPNAGPGYRFVVRNTGYITLIDVEIPLFGYVQKCRRSCNYNHKSYSN